MVVKRNRTYFNYKEIKSHTVYILLLKSDFKFFVLMFINERNQKNPIFSNTELEL